MNAIEVDNITKKFGARDVLSSLSFNIKYGRVHGLLGPNGAGKTTTLKILTQLLTADSGEVRYFNHAGNFVIKENTNFMGHLLERPTLYSDLTVYETLSFLAKLRNISKSDFEESLNYCVEKLRLQDVLHRLTLHLSTGYKQRLGIACALIHKPEILILDEPSSGLDPQSVVELRNFIKEIKEDHTVIVSGHILAEMEMLCDDVTIISHGAIKASGDLALLQKEYAQTQSLHLKSLNYSSEFETKIQEMNQVNTLEHNIINGVHSYKIEVGGEEELRPLILKNATHYHIQPLELTMTSKSLEDLFIEVTKE